MKIIKKIFVLVIIFSCLNFSWPSYSLDYDEMPESATLSANRMRFDAVTGDFLADGNVIIEAGELKVEAPVGSGNVDRREINFDEGLELSFYEIPTCNFLNSVRGGLGTMRLDADRLLLTGLGGISDPSETDTQTKFWIINAKKLEDTSKGLSFGANTIEGILRNGDLHEMTADKSVWLKGKPKSKGDAVSLRGDHALYSLERGSVVVSGHVVAVQGGRTLKSDSIVYFPEQNRVEALGGLTKEVGGVVSTDRAEITIDLSKERKVKKEDKKEKLEIKIEPEKKSGKKSETTKKTTTRTKRNSKK